MKTLFIAVFLVVSLGYSKLSSAQVDSAKLLKTEKQMETNKNDVNKMDKKIRKEENKIKKRERKSERVQKKRDKELNRIRKQEQQIEKIKKDSIN